MRRIFLIATSLIFALAAAGNALAAAERRIALVIGNNDYQNVTKLEKAVNDANSVARELKKIGFEVMAYNNVGQKKMNLAVNEFVQKISGGGVGVFFFAGHGLQVNNQNFLVPVDMDSPRSENDLADQAVSVLAIQDKIADAKAKFTLLVLDACRDNPLPKKSGTRSIGATRGLAPPQAPNGQVVLYSAGANQQALDKLGDNDNNPNGLFTREFLPSITQPGISATDAMRRVRSTVTQKAKSVGHDQQPALYEQTDGDFYFVAGPAPAAPSSPTTVVQTVDPKAVELAFWDSIKNSKTPDDFSDYLNKYPDGQFSALAKRRLTATSQTVTRGGDSAAAPAPEQLALSSQPRPAAETAPSIASKIEELGKMASLQVSDMRATRRDNLLRIQVEITNTSSSNQQMYYRFKWLDRDGFSVWDDEPWKPLLVYGLQKQLINVVGPTFKATDFRLILQSPNNISN
ncbi:MAG: DUF1425 domain-containing protein [Candidatus Accumulibacter sp.]|nr:DUF1425 domain-containing protein [Accumulibacter sp.]